MKTDAELRRACKQVLDWLRVVEEKSLCRDTKTGAIGMQGVLKRALKP